MEEKEGLLVGPRGLHPARTSLERGLEVDEGGKAKKV